MNTVRLSLEPLKLRSSSSSPCRVQTRVSLLPDQHRHFDLRRMSAVIDEYPRRRGADDPAGIGFTQGVGGFDHARVRVVEEQRAEA
jgi:hypothetical protein